MSNKAKADFELTKQLPSAQQFNNLRSLIGWRCMTEQQTDDSLQRSLFAVSAIQEKTLVGFARIVGDGVMYFYIQDVMVHPDQQGNGLGHLLMTEIEHWLSTHTTSGSTVGLLAAKDKEGFYQRYGYLSRPSDGTGAGMYRFVTSESTKANDES